MIIEPVGQYNDDAVSPEDDVRIRRKVDWMLLPLLCAIYCLQFLDKTCLSYASIMGIRTDLNLTLGQYSWLSSIFYLGYLAGEYPMSLALQRFPLAKVTAINIIAWGVILCLMSVGKNFAGLMIIRFFLGFFESSITPALALLTAQWYKVSEQGTRTGIWFSFNASGAIIGGSMAYGLARADSNGTLPIEGWKLVFIILGVISAAVGVLFGLFVPDSPDQARFLNVEDRKLASVRIRGNQQVTVDKTFIWSQAWEAIRDPLTWMYAMIALTTSIPNGGVTNFFSILIVGLGFTTQETLLLGIANAWLAPCVIFFLWLGDKLRNRCLVSIIPTVISIVGTLMVWLIPAESRIPRLAGFYLILPFVVAMVVALSLVTSNVAGRTKKTTVNTIFLVFYCVGNLIGPQTFQADNAPLYMPALATIVACDAAVVILLLGVYAIYVRENKRRDALETGTNNAVEGVLLDLTDRENLDFRYTL